MPESNEKLVETQKPAESPLVFISHDSKDAELAEAFAKLLKSVSAGMLKSFRSSDKKGTEGIEFGDEWYKALMGKLILASDVVCLLTERSLERPWILYEAGVAKGKLNTPVHGLALGVSLAKVSIGPFYQFQNSDDSEESLVKLVLQLCRRIANLEPDQEVVATQVHTFKTCVTESLKKLGSQKKADSAESVNEESVAKVLEEMKLVVRDVSMRFEERLRPDSTAGLRSRRFSFRRFHPGMIDELTSMVSRRRNDPIGILIIASLFRDDLPWLYEIGLEAYHAAKRRNLDRARATGIAFRDALEAVSHVSFMEEMGIEVKNTRALRELPGMVHRYIEHLEAEIPRRRPADPSEPIS